MARKPKGHSVERMSRLRSAMADAGHRTQASLAAGSGIPAYEISRLVNGRRSPTYRHLVGLSVALNLRLEDVAEMFAMHEIPPTSPKVHDLTRTVAACEIRCRRLVAQVAALEKLSAVAPRELLANNRNLIRRVGQAEGAVAGRDARIASLCLDVETERRATDSLLDENSALRIQVAKLEVEVEHLRQHATKENDDE